MPRLPKGRRMSLISARDLGVDFGGKTVLHSVDFDIQPGEIVTLVGPNGSGKTTMLRALIGAIPHQHGDVTRQDGLRIGYVPQKLAIDASLPLSVERFLNLPRRQTADRIAKALAQAGVTGQAGQHMANLSGGQFQRVLLARALLMDPHILVLDEATQGLDQSGSAAFYTKLAEMRSALNCAVLMVSHELHVVMSASDRVLCLNGHVCCAGTPEVVATAPEYRALFGTGTQGALALYRHTHDHAHDHDHSGQGPAKHGPAKQDHSAKGAIQ